MFVTDAITDLDMSRNLDLTALRSFVTVAETGGVTRAARVLNLTQSAVSMQLKRLEEALGQPLLDRSGRGITTTPQGEQLLTYGQRMLALNDEIWARMIDDGFEGELRLGVPCDIVYPHMPQIMRRLACEYPRVKLHLVSSHTNNLKVLAERGELDLFLTTEREIDSGGETLAVIPLTWIGAVGGTAWKSRPLRIASSANCIFRPIAREALDQAGIPWELAVDTGSDRAIEVTVAADLAVGVLLRGTQPEDVEPVPDDGTLPPLPGMRINLYRCSGASGLPVEALAGMIRTAYGAPARMAAE